jgi:3',5'-cyclic AMP phosphodiesterase CpdA
MNGGRLFAISDLHVAFRENREIVENLRPSSDNDWLLVAGDVGELTADIEWALGHLRSRFSVVAWAPGNHELWTPRTDPVQLRGERRYRYLVDVCRGLDVLTPEDPYPVWEGPWGPVVVAPLFVLYDYSFRSGGARSKAEALANAYGAGVVCSDEFLLYPDPYPSREAWCDARLAATKARLDAVDRDLPMVLVNHFPLIREPTLALRHQEFALWCGTERTADWHRRYRAAAVIYGHLHIARTTWCDGVPFEEVSVGYPREWRHRAFPPGQLRAIRPAPVRITGPGRASRPSSAAGRYPPASDR